MIGIFKSFQEYTPATYSTISRSIAWGQIAGEYYFLSGSNSNSSPHVGAYVYSNGTFTTLSAPFGNNTYYASSINNSGQIVGIYFGAPQGFLYDHGTYTSLPLYLNDYNQITGINENLRWND